MSILLKVFLCFFILPSFCNLPTYADYLITEHDEDHFHTTGSIDGESYFATIIPLDDFTYRRGNLGSKFFRTTSHRVGDFIYINGSIGKEWINISEYPCGTRTCRRGSIGDESYRTTTKKLGDRVITSGWYGNELISATSSKQEDGSILTSGLISGVWFGD